MRVLLVGPMSDFTAGVQRAFVSEGHRVEYIDERGLRHWPMLWRLVRRASFLRQASNRLLGWRIVHRARRFRPELVLMVKGTTVKEHTLHALKAAGAKVANWFPENGRNEPYRTWLERYIGAYDHFFCFDSGLLDRKSDFPGTRLTYLPLGVDPEAFKVDGLSSADHARYDADVCFVGAWYPERERLLAGLNDVKLKIFGWREWARTPLADRYGGPLDARESAKAYRCAKIVLNVNLEPPVNGVNGKTFEICAAGGFQLTDFRADLPELFVEGQEVVVFRSSQELAEAVQRYLGKPAERERIAQAGRARILRDHTLRSRVRAIILAVC